MVAGYSDTWDTVTGSNSDSSFSTDTSLSTTTSRIIVIYSTSSGLTANTDALDSGLRAAQQAVQRFACQVDDADDLDDSKLEREPAPDRPPVTAPLDTPRHPDPHNDHRLPARPTSHASQYPRPPPRDRPVLVGQYVSSAQLIDIDAA